MMVCSLIDVFVANSLISGVTGSDYNGTEDEDINLKSIAIIKIIAVIVGEREPG